MKNEAIEMIKTPLSVVRVVAFCLPLVLVASCGSGSEAVQGTRVNISPTSIGVTSDVTSAAAVLYVVQTYQIELRTPAGAPQIGTNLTIINNGTLYDGEVIINTAAVTCNAITLACTDTSKSAVPSTYHTTTDSSGSKRVTIIYGFVPGTKGTVTDLEVFSGTSYNKTDIVFTCTDGNTAGTAPDCPT